MTNRKFLTIFCVISVVMFWVSCLGDGFIESDPWEFVVCENGLIYVLEGK